MTLSFEDYSSRCEQIHRFLHIYSKFTKEVFRGKLSPFCRGWKLSTIYFLNGQTKTKYVKVWKTFLFCLFPHSNFISSSIFLIWPKISFKKKKLGFFILVIQRYVQNAVKHLRWSFFREQSTAESRYFFSKKPHSGSQDEFPIRIRYCFSSLLMLALYSNLFALNKGVITPLTLMSTKMSYILKQTCSWNPLVCLKMYDLSVDNQC